MKQIKISELKDGMIVSGYQVRIWQDDMPIDPRKDYDHLGTMSCSHRRCKIGDEQINSGNFNSWGEVKTWLVRAKGALVILPIYMIDHSGIAISTRGFRDCDPQGWDSGQVGFIWVSKADVKKEYGTCGKRSIEKATAVLEAEVEEYSAYLEGDVWAYTITAPDGEVVGGCNGFIDFYNSKETMKQYIEAEINSFNRPNPADVHQAIHGCDPWEGAGDGI